MKKIFNITDKKEIKDKKIYKGIILGRKISKILKKENSIENKKSKIKYCNLKSQLIIKFQTFQIK